MEKYDAIIIGGSISGLSLGSELSKKQKILVIEKGLIRKEHKTWTTEKKIIEEAGLKQFIQTTFDKCYFKSLNRERFFTRHVAVSLDDVALISFFKKTIIDNRSIISENCTFLEIVERQENGLIIKTSKGNLFTRLLIDCSGLESLLITKYEVYDKNIYYPVYGGVYDISLKGKDICAGELMSSDFPLSWIETFPINNSQSIIYTFQYINKKIDPMSLKSVHDYQIKNCYLKNELVNKKMVREIYGIIPMGQIKRHSADNIFFFGDSSLIASPMIGSGFTNIIQHYKKFANHLSEKLTKNTLKEKDLNYSYSEMELINRNIQIIIGTILVYSKSGDIDFFIDVIKSIPHKTLADVIFLRMDINEIGLLLKTIIEKFGLPRLAQILPREEYMFIAKEAVKVVEEITIEEFEEIFHKHHPAI